MHASGRDSHPVISALRQFSSRWRRPVARWCGEGEGEGTTKDELLVELLRSRVRMLGLVAQWAFAAVAVIALPFAATGSPGGIALVVLGVIGAAMGVALPRIARTLRRPIGLHVSGSAFVLLVALAMAVTEVAIGGNRARDGISGIAVWIMIVPLLLPMRMPQAVMTLLGCATMVPLVALVERFAGGQPLSLYQLAAWAGPLYFSAVIAAAISCALARQAAALAQARQDLAELGRYRLVRQLGSGGMGEVMLAEHRLLRRPVAVKLLHPEFCTDEHERLFFGEAEATATLSSPHTVRLLDYGRSADGRLYSVMELLDGSDLHRAVEAWGPLPDWRVARILHQICHALAEAHAAGICHRDITPANLMLCRSGGEIDVVKVLDFGLARAAADGDGIIGTPGFIAPEAITGEALSGPQGDLYALGSCAWWMLTGQVLFDDDDPERILVAHVNRPLPDLAALAPGVDPGLLQLVRWTLTKSPRLRPADAGTLRRRIEGLACFAHVDPDAVEAWWARRDAALRERARDSTIPVTVMHPRQVSGIGARSR